MSCMHHHPATLHGLPALLVGVNTNHCLGLGGSGVDSGVTGHSHGFVLNCPGIRQLLCLLLLNHASGKRGCGAREGGSAQIASHATGLLLRLAHS
eukprot:352791-Chlamydomonas_euryale.AAC.6